MSSFASISSNSKREKPRDARARGLLQAAGMLGMLAEARYNVKGNGIRVNDVVARFRRTTGGLPVTFGMPLALVPQYGYRISKHNLSNSPAKRKGRKTRVRGEKGSFSRNFWRTFGIFWNLLELLGS